MCDRRAQLLELWQSTCSSGTCSLGHLPRMSWWGGFVESPISQSYLPAACKREIGIRQEKLEEEATELDRRSLAEQSYS